MRTLQQILEAAGHAPFAYSPPCYEGTTCPGVRLATVNDLGRLFGNVLVEVKEDERVPTAVAFSRMRVDSCLRDPVAYFPYTPHAKP